MAGVQPTDGDGGDGRGGLSPIPDEDEVYVDRDDVREEAASTQRTDNDRTSTRPPKRWWKTIDSFNLTCYRTPYALSEEQKQELGKLLGLKPEAVHSGGKRHGHPISACIRDVAETMVMRQLRGKKVLDAGGSVLRHHTRNAQSVHCCHSGQPEWRKKMQDWLLKIKDKKGVKKDLEQICRPRNEVTYCYHGIKNCGFKAEAGMCTDAAYYFDDETDFLDKISGNLAYIIGHYYPQAGKYLLGEHNVVLLSDNRVRVKIRGAEEVYTHKQLNISPRERVAGNKIWEIAVKIKFGDYYVLECKARDLLQGKSVKLPQKREALSKPPDPVRLTNQGSGTMDLRVPGQRTAAPPHEIKSGDIREWEFKGDYTRRQLVLEPVCHTLATEINPTSLRSEGKLTTIMYKRYEDLARQYNLTPEQYSIYKKSSITVAYVLGLATDLSVPRRYYNSTLQKWIHRGIINPLRRLTFQDCFDPDEATLKLGQMVTERKIDLLLLDKILYGFYGISSFQAGVQEEAATVPWNTTLPSTPTVLSMLTLMTMIGVVMSFHLPHWDIWRLRRS